MKTQHGGVSLRQHVRGEMDFNAATVTCIGNKPPAGRRTGLKRKEVLAIQWRDEAVGVDPYANSLDQNVAVHRQRRMKIRGQHAIVFGIHATEIDAHPRHAADAIGQQDKIVGCGAPSAECETTGSGAK